MINYLDGLLGKITMYRLMQDFLRVLVVIAIVLSFFHKLPFRPQDLIFSVLFLVVSCWVFNQVISKILKIPVNLESQYITGIILALILTPEISWAAVKIYLLATFVAMASKYVFAWKGKHIFNPATLGAVAVFYILGQGASWWVGNPWMVAFVAIGGLLILRKIQHFDLVLSFLAVTIIGLCFTSVSPLLAIESSFLYSSLVFFSAVMLIEPLTTPPTRTLRIAYGALVGVLTFVHFGIFYFLPEIALLIGSIFSFIVSPKARMLVTLKSKNLIATDTYDLAFEKKQQFDFKPGQYLEWTLPITKTDSRGNRRYFTISSSPTEKELHLGVKFYEKPSTFKKTLFELPPGTGILVGQLAGEFVMPKKKDQKLAFIAGGIGITPFRSMIKYLLDHNEHRDIVLFYSAKSESEFAYQDLLSEAAKLGVKLIKTDRLTKEQIETQAADYKERKFYISGPHGMVVAFENTLKEMGLPSRQIKIDFFPGYA